MREEEQKPKKNPNKNPKKIISLNFCFENFKKFPRFQISDIFLNISKKHFFLQQITFFWGKNYCSLSFAI